VNQGNDHSDQTTKAKGGLYWLVATFVVLLLLLGLPMGAIGLVFAGVPPMVVLGLFISLPGVVLLAVGAFRPELLFRGFHSESPDIETAAKSEGRLNAIIIGLGFIIGGVTFAVTTEVWYAILAFIGAQVLLALGVKRGA